MTAARDPLVCVKRAAEARARADDQYRAALAEAHKAGAGYAELARVAGVSRQAVRQLIARHRPAVDEAEAMRTRLAALDQRWDALVDRLAARHMPDERTRRREQAYRNKINGRSAKKGSRTRKRLPTVGEETRRLAETEILRLLHDRPDDPLVRRIRAEVDEAETLRLRLEAIDEARRGF